MTLAEFVTKYRAEHDLSQRQFAKICDLTNTTIHNIETNPNYVPGGSVLVKIAAGTGNDANDFLLNVIDDMKVSLASDSITPNKQEKRIIELYRSNSAFASAVDALYKGYAHD